MSNRENRPELGALPEGLNLFNFTDHPDYLPAPGSGDEPQIPGLDLEEAARQRVSEAFGDAQDAPAADKQSALIASNISEVKPSAGQLPFTAELLAPESTVRSFPEWRASLAPPADEESRRPADLSPKTPGY